MLITEKNSRFKKLVKRTGLLVLPILCFLTFSTNTKAQSTVIDVETFDKVVVSPHIEVVFKEGSKESITIESSTVPSEKLNVEVKNNALHIYLEGARIATGNKKENRNGREYKTSLYTGTVVRATITYIEINSLDLRGEERFVFESTLNSDKLHVNVYGASEVFMKEVNITNMQASLYGESHLNIDKGTIEKQKIRAYGESKVNTANIKNKETKLTCYGDGTFQLNVSEKLKISSFGEATIIYSGSPTINKGLILGETKITKVTF